MGFVLNDVLVMVCYLVLIKVMWGLVVVVYGLGKVDIGLKCLVGEVVSKVVGCFYCLVYVVYGVREQGVVQEKIDVVWSFEDSLFFIDVECVVINLVMKVGVVLNEIMDVDFECLWGYFLEDDIIEIVVVIVMFGFFN